jgi:hypothetical protein
MIMIAAVEGKPEREGRRIRRGGRGGGETFAGLRVPQREGRRKRDIMLFIRCSPLHAHAKACVAARESGFSFFAMEGRAKAMRPGSMRSTMGWRGDDDVRGAPLVVRHLVERPANQLAAPVAVGFVTLAALHTIALQGFRHMNDAAAGDNQT